MVLMAGLELPSKAIREQISAAIDFVVHLTRMPDGTRKLEEIIELTGMEGDTIVSQKIFEFKQKGYDKNHMVVGSFDSTGIVPNFIHGIKERGIPVDITVFRKSSKAKA
jgi:pilus assembly protein CpaF